MRLLISNSNWLRGFEGFAIKSSEKMIKTKGPATCWFQPWPFYPCPRSLEVTFPTFETKKNTWTHHPKVTLAEWLPVILNWWSKKIGCTCGLPSINFQGRDVRLSTLGVVIFLKLRYPLEIQKGRSWGCKSYEKIRSNHRKLRRFK